MAIGQWEEYIYITRINLATGGLESRNVTRRWWHTENGGPTVCEDLCSDKRRDFGWEAERRVKISRVWVAPSPQSLVRKGTKW